MKNRLNLLLISMFLSGGLAAQCSDFVKVNGKNFTCGGNLFYPVVLNYPVGLYHVTGVYNNIFPCREHQFFTTNSPASQTPGITTQAQATALLQSDMVSIKAAGFNTIRAICAFYGSTPVYAWPSTTPRTTYPAIGTGDLSNNDYYVTDLTSNTQVLINALQTVIDAATQAGLKVILLTGGNEIVSYPTATSISSGYITYLQQLAAAFQYNPTLMAIDFLNEPGNGLPIDEFQTKGMSKTSVCSVTTAWYNAVKGSSKILTTIGFNGSVNVADWDPNIAKIDFASFHPYPSLQDLSGYASDLNVNGGAIDRIRSEFTWYRNNVNIPWMVGETGFMAQVGVNHPVTQFKNINGDLADQNLYLNATLNASRDYGGAGFSWWAVSDVQSNNFMGLFSSDNNLVLKQSLPGITAFNPTPIPSNYVRPMNYYNYWNTGTTYSVTGKVLTTSGVPIQDALVDSWDHNWHRLGSTFTDVNGNYTLFATGVVEIVMVAAVDCRTITDYNYMGNSFNHLTGLNYNLIKISRPTVNALAYSNQTVSNVNVNSYSASTVSFNNYVINSGNFSTTAASSVSLGIGTVVKKGTYFNARLGSFYHDCSTLVDNGGSPFMVSHEKPTPKMSGQNVNIFPNPADGGCHIRMEKEDTYIVEIFNLYGAKIRSFQFTGNGQDVDLLDARPGIYLFVIRDSENLISTIRLVKE